MSEPKREAQVRRQWYVPEAPAPNLRGKQTFPEVQVQQVSNRHLVQEASVQDPQELPLALEAQALGHRLLKAGNQVLSVYCHMIQNEIGGQAQVLHQ